MNEWAGEKRKKGAEADASRPVFQASNSDVAYLRTYRILVRSPDDMIGMVGGRPAT